MSDSSSTNEPASQVDWEGIAERPAFKDLLRSKARFIIAATIFFTVYYFSLPILVGWWPELMKKKIGPVNWAYAFALSQFVMSWVIAWLYVKAASKFDKQAAAVIEDIQQH